MNKTAWAGATPSARKRIAAGGAPCGKAKGCGCAGAARHPAPKPEAAKKTAPVKPPNAAGNNDALQKQEGDNA